ncbi:hypothetical protein KCU73_g5693, partial [Aureobasidium melanogenum]
TTEAKTDEQASNATLDKKRATPIIARPVPFPERFGEKPQVPTRDAFLTESFESSSQSSDQLRACRKVEKKIKALEEKIEHLEKMRQICENALTFLEQQKKMASSFKHSSFATTFILTSRTMSSGRVVITIDDDDESLEGDNVGNTTQNQVQRLERDLSSSRNTITYVQEYLQGELTSLQNEHARLQAKYVRLRAKNARIQAEDARRQADNTRLRADVSRIRTENARLRAQLRVELLEDSQPHLSSPANARRHSMRVRGFDQDAAREDLRVHNDGLPDAEGEVEAFITVRISQDGKLETDSQANDQEWHELEAAWAVQVRQFDQKNKDWPSVDLKGKCLWSSVISKPTAQHWTTEEPGRFACRQCANKLRICAGQVNGTLQLLPLPPLPFSADHEVNNLLGRYVVKEGNVSRRAPPVWS